MEESLDPDFIPFKHSPTPEERAQEEKRDNEIVQKIFDEAMNPHPIIVDGQEKVISTESHLNNSYCITIADKDGENPKLFLLNTATEDLKHKDEFENMAYLIHLEYMDREELKYIYREFSEIADKVDKMGDPNKISVPEMGVYITIGDQKYYFNYFPKGAGVGNHDAVKEIKRNVGLRNRKIV